ncbi:16 kDa beta-galactoside-binding lectin [Anolis carolinensis]|uniref:Galectin n=2 Tax=Anolis carolinensis TaxID=28377 RepID=G1KGG0_ANOCA|nr:PREDICTED: 16 kDa beta-galactoside-binding lectin [Anolis carolinensis]|eukprot:XP_003218018.1 PREDICTED: 16 kDa beta-galactoside-binding lectin [Anolis carolinensis]
MALKLLLHSKIKSGECIKVKGKVSPEATSFSINLGWDETNLILHFNPRFDLHGDTRTIVCNSRREGEWGEELRVSEFPFQQGEETKICVSFDAEEVIVKLPEGQELKFPNRLGLETAEYFSVVGDLDIKSIKFD